MAAKNVEIDCSSDDFSDDPDYVESESESEYFHPKTSRAIWDYVSKEDVSVFGNGKYETWTYPIIMKCKGENTVLKKFTVKQIHNLSLQTSKSLEKSTIKLYRTCRLKRKNFILISPVFSYLLSETYSKMNYCTRVDHCGRRNETFSYRFIN